MAWADDKQRHLDAASGRQVRAQMKEARMKTARRLYESGVSLEEIAQRAHAGNDTIRKWIADGGWKRGGS